MILRSVRSNQPSFRPLVLSPGFNVVLADRTKESTKKDSRNGLGKSTLVEIIHFCLGGDIDEGTLKAQQMRGWTFTLDVDLDGNKISVSRTPSDLRVVQVEGDFNGWPVQPRRNKESGAWEYRIPDWKTLLGNLVFGLPVDDGDTYRPTFRGLIPYFIRRGRDAYSNPFEHFRKQKEYQTQIYTAFLLDLDWTYARELQRLKDKKKSLDILKKSAQSGFVRDVLGSVGDLEAVRVRLTDATKALEEQLASFRVHPQYREIEERANQLTKEIHDLENRNIVDSRLLEIYQASIKEEQPPEMDRVEEVFQEAGLALPGVVRKRLDDVRKFHVTVIENRAHFLAAEIARLEKTLEGRRESIQLKSEERAKLMNILKSHGALNEYNQLHQRHLENLAKLRDTEARIERLKECQKGDATLRMKQQQLHQQAISDLEDRRKRVDRARSLFNSISEILYRAPGKLLIDALPGGYKFGVEIERSGSHGIDSMQVFCYDLMLMQLWAKRSPGPDFLVHDSTIFHGVDERQMASGIELMERETRERGFQYLCMMNTDTIPTREFSRSFDLKKFVSLTLTDASEEGCLLGVRF